MGRPSKLTEPMREEIGRRIAAGESIRALGREFHIAESTLRENFSAQVPKIRKLATTLASAELEVAELPVSAQRAVRDLTNQLKSIQSSLTNAAASGAKTAEKLQRIAEKRADKVSEATQPEELKPIAALVATANEAARVATTLVQANKGKAAEDDAPPLDLSLLRAEELAALEVLVMKASPNQEGAR